MISHDIQRLEKFLQNAEIEKIFDEAFPALEGVDTSVTNLFLSISARFKSLENDKAKGIISQEDWKPEFNKIINSLNKAIQRLGELAPDKFNSKRSREVVMDDIEKLSQEFISVESRESKLAKMRMRVNLAREIADKLIL